MVATPLTLALRKQRQTELCELYRLSSRPEQTHSNKPALRVYTGRPSTLGITKTEQKFSTNCTKKILTRGFVPG